ncbi:hypothetical protein [Plantactinospora sonchi]|uniref:Serine/threonine protein kinase n=1 Tax=Plantactinospora sonchi TaxID=1544735 RepID=A0ABU7RVU7_9ACTN
MPQAKQPDEPMPKKKPTKDKGGRGISIKNSTVTVGDRNSAGNKTLPPATSSTPDKLSGHQKILLVATVVAAVATVVGVSYNLTGADGPTDGNPPPSQSPTTVRAAPLDVSVIGKVANTFEVPLQKPVGVRAYRDPGPGGSGTQVAQYPEGETLSIACRHKGGRRIDDHPWRDRPLSTTTWYRLSGLEARYVPDMYVMLTDDGHTPARDLPDC